VTGRLDLAAQLRGHGLHAVANAEHGHAHVEHFLGRFRTFDVVNRFGSAGENHGLRREALDLLRIDVARIDLGVHAEFTHAASDQLGVLGAEIEDQNAIVMNVGHQPIR